MRFLSTENMYDGARARVRPSSELFLGPAAAQLVMNSCLAHTNVGTCGPIHPLTRGAATPSTTHGTSASIIIKPQGI